MNEDANLNIILDKLLKNNLDLSKLNQNDIKLILEHIPQLVDRFDLSKLSEFYVSMLLRVQPQPQLVDKLDEYEIADLVKAQTKLKSFFDKYWK